MHIYLNYPMSMMWSVDIFDRSMLGGQRVRAVVQRQPLRVHVVGPAPGGRSALPVLYKDFL